MPVTTAVPSPLANLLAAVAGAVLGFAVVRSRGTGDDAARSVARVALVAVVASLAAAVDSVLDPAGPRFAAAVAAGATAVVLLLGVVLLVWGISSLAAAFNRFLDER